MRKKIRPGYAPWLAVVFLLTTGCVAADSLDVAVSRGAVVYNGDSTDVRLLMEIALPTALDSVEIRFAELRVAVASVIPDSSVLTMYCRPLLIPWDPYTIGWADLGDFPDTAVVSRRGTHFGTAAIGPQSAYFDITRILKNWRGGGVVNYGLLLYANPRQLPRFTYQRQGEESFGTVHVKYGQPMP